MFFLGRRLIEGPEKGYMPSIASRALALGAREGPWALRAPHVPRAPEGLGPLVSGALTWGPWGPTPFTDSIKKKVEMTINNYKLSVTVR